jgi:hypothetical protein
MEELEDTLKEKVKIYTNLLRVADIMNKKEDVRYYISCIDKLNKMLKIL